MKRSILFFSLLLLAFFVQEAEAANCQGQVILCGGEWMYNVDSCGLSGGEWYGYCSDMTEPPGCQGDTILCGGEWMHNVDSCGLGGGNWYGYCSK